jgi:hypothetical protein
LSIERASSPPGFSNQVHHDPLPHPRELPFQEGRPLPPSDDEDESQMVRSAKRFAPSREVFMIHTGEDCEGVERVQLDNYDDYLLDPLDEDVDVTMGVEFLDNIKIEDADDI